MQTAWRQYRTSMATVSNQHGAGMKPACKLHPTSMAMVAGHCRHTAFGEGASCCGMNVTERSRAGHVLRKAPENHRWGHLVTNWHQSKPGAYLLAAFAQHSLSPVAMPRQYAAPFSPAVTVGATLASPQPLAARKNVRAICSFGLKCLGWWKQCPSQAPEPGAWDRVCHRSC
jgi:hypothetical protein